jgi:RNA polymerase sigma-70 factor, ECF subfamily
MSSASSPVRKAYAARAQPAELGQDLAAGDAALLAAASTDLQAFEALYRRYEKRVYNYVYLLARNATLAEEVVADTMLAVWRGARGFAGSSRVSTWILGIARHKAIDAVRRAAREDNVAPLEEGRDVIDPQPSPAAQASRAEEAAQLKRVIGGLSPEHQEILRLVFYEELPYEDIAQLVGIPVNTVKTRVFYAKQQLKLRLEKVRNAGVQA